jgi:hypothetical protein
MSKRNPVVYDEGRKGRRTHKRFPKVNTKKLEKEKKVGGVAG